MAVVGAFICWIISFTILGSWLVHGINLLTVNISIGDLYQLGAAAGFFAGFLKFEVES